MAYILSNWVSAPIDLDDSINDVSWENAGKIEVQGGYLMAKNNDEFLYIALDMVDDTGNNAGTGDYFWFTFDRNRNAAITPNYDVNYGLYPGNPNKMGRQYYLGPGRWTGLLNERSPSQNRIEFGSSPNSPTPHRIWKMRFLLSEINVSLSSFFPYTRFGFRAASSTPSFRYNEPANFYRDFSRLHILYLARKRTFPTGNMGTIFGGVGLIPFDRINTSTGRATTASSYRPYVQNAAFGGRLDIIGNRITLGRLGGRKYKVLHRAGTSGRFEPLLSSWTNYQWSNTLRRYVLRHFGPDSAGKYTLPSASTDYSIDDLLIQFNTVGLTRGLHQFRIDFDAYTNDTEILTLYIDNNLPEVNINSITHNGVGKSACSIVHMTSERDGLKFRITAHDPEGNLRGFNLSAHWGSNKGESIFSRSYPGSGLWTGVSNLLIPSSGEWTPETTCAYQFRVSATARTTNGYGYIGYTAHNEHLTIIKPGGTRSVGTESTMANVMPVGYEEME